MVICLLKIPRHIYHRNRILYARESLAVSHMVFQFFCSLALTCLLLRSMVEPVVFSNQTVTEWVRFLLHEIVFFQSPVSLLFSTVNRNLTGGVVPYATSPLDWIDRIIANRHQGHPTTVFGEISVRSPLEWLKFSGAQEQLKISKMFRGDCSLGSEFRDLCGLYSFTPRIFCTFIRRFNWL